MHREYVTQTLAAYEQKYIPYYQGLADSVVIPEQPSLEDLLALEASARTTMLTLAKAPPKQPAIDALEYIKQQYEPKLNAFEESKKALTQHRFDEIKRMNDERSAKVQAAEAKAVQGVKPLIEKHNKLLAYKDQIEDICGRYSISPSDIGISTDISAEEYDALLDASIEGCQSMLKQTRNKKSPIALLYKPLEWDDWRKKVIAITLFVILFNWVGGFVAIAFFWFMLSNTHGVYKRLDKLKIASALMQTPDFDKFMKKDEVEAIPELDFTSLDEECANKLKELDAADPNIELSKAMQDLNSDIEWVGQQQAASFDKIKKFYAETSEALKSKFVQIQTLKKEAIEKLVDLGDGMLDEKSHTYPSNKYILGKLKGTIPQRVPVPVGNYHFNSEAEGMLDFLKLMLCNALLDIREKQLTVLIVDPEGLGQNFAEFISRDKETHDFIKIERSNVDNVLAKTKDDLTKNIRYCGNRTIEEVNEEFESKGMVTLSNVLAVLVSGQGDYCEKKDNKTFIETSYKYGLRIWDFSPTPIEGIINFNKPFDGIEVDVPYVYDYNLGIKCTNTYAEAVLNSKDGSIDYFTSIQEKYIPREKWGTWSTLKGIELNFGLADGDPSKGFPMTLGDANVHLLMAGQSGAGKSAAINQMLLSLITKYSPQELMLVMVDFKNVEFSTFTVKDDMSDDRISIIPHARVMAGTKDGEYALSIFDFLIHEMESRQKLLGAVNQKKLEDYNNLMDEQGHPEKKLPRILLLIDEFQVMFTEVDRKIVDIIQDRIRSLAKLARAFGCHMWFTSQSMQGTMSNDVKGNFSMRAALRCTRDVSSEIIGNGAAGEIKAKFGYLITNDSTGQDPTKNITWRVPFVSTKDILKTMHEAADLYASQGMKGYHAIFYDEEQLYPDKRLFDFYERHKSNPKVQNKHLLVMGERTSFSTNDAPVNFYLERGDNQNIVVGAMEDADMLNMCRTFLDNIEVHGLKYIISCADEDAHQLLELDARLKQPYLDWSYPNVPFKDWIDEEKSPLRMVIKKRLEMEEPNYDPIYVILYNWDKYPGFGVAENSKVGEKFKELLRLGPTVDVHFILIVRTKGEIAPSGWTTFNHKIGCLMDEGTSYKIIDSTKCNKLPNKGGYAIYKRGNTETKFKIYQHEFSRKLADKELKL